MAIDTARMRPSEGAGTPDGQCSARDARGRKSCTRDSTRATPRIDLPRGDPARLVAAGDVWTRADAEALIDKGASAVAVGRAAIANPGWASRVGQPEWVPRRPPLIRAELVARGLSPAFAEMMRRWKGFVAD
jgi:2,4-dienoyl-CoA reductase-like NADH-dependent reductase (Old Yellow Enzyme family)